MEKAWFTAKNNAKNPHLLKLKLWGVPLEQKEEEKEEEGNQLQSFSAK